MNSDAVAAVRAAALAAGLACDRLIALRSTNNAVYLIEPAMVVAKVHRTVELAERERRIAALLADAGAPVVAPVEGLSIAVEHEADLVVTYWECAAPGPAHRSAADLATALFELHQVLRLQAEELAVGDRCIDVLDGVHELLVSDALETRVDPSDRELLGAAIDQSRNALVTRDDAVLHGSPHMGNVIATRTGALFIDWETVCLGPVEWDLAHLDDEVARRYPGPVERDLLEACRLGVSAATSTWCWADVERGEDMRVHALHHLEVVRNSLGN